MYRRGKMRGRIVSQWRVVLFTVVCMSLMFSSAAFSAGFALVEQGVKGLGNAYAGGSAGAEDASTIFFNPAGITRLNGQQVIFAAHYIMPYANFENKGSTHVTGAPLRGDSDGNAADARIIPNFYYSRKMGDRFFMGIGVNAPFGLSTEYDRTWVGRYHAVKSDLMTLNINPSVAYQFTDQLSIGAGFSIQYAKAELSSAVDFGTIGASFGIPGLLPQRNDGYFDLEGDSWSGGYNLGLLYEFTKNTRAGVSYRSRIEHTLSGDAEFSGVPTPFRSTFRDTDAEAEVTFPDSLSVSFFHQFNPQWMVMADFTWTNWSLFEELIVEFDNGNPSNRTIEKWQDSYRYSLGATYLPDKNWAVRIGTAYDTSAVAHAKYRTPRIPDGDRIWAALGLGYKVSDMIGIDIGYSHLFINDPDINKTATDDDRLRGALRGTYSTHIDIVSAQLTMSF
jgi:long-chain fatty acid transport protein